MPMTGNVSLNNIPHRRRIEHIKWSPSYSVGVKLLDDQHKWLLNFVNDLFNHATGDKKEELAYFKNVVQQAVNYIKHHFATEEKFMTATNFPGYAEHKKAHDTFTKTVVNTVKDYQAGKRLALAKYAHFMKDWILSHVAVMDVQYAQHFRQIATRKDDGILSITKADLN